MPAEILNIQNKKTRYPKKKENQAYADYRSKVRTCKPSFNYCVFLNTHFEGLEPASKIRNKGVSFYNFKPTEFIRLISILYSNQAIIQSG